MKDQEAATDDLQAAAADATTTGDPSHTEEEIQAWLISNIAALVEIDPKSIDIQKPLEYYGMDSMQAMHLSGDLADWLGRQLSPTVVWDYPTIELLANHLAKNEEHVTSIENEEQF
jgi:acyl carrier protein